MVEKNKNNGQFNLKRYETDVAGVSVNKLEAGLWWLKNKLALKKILIGFLLSLILSFWGYSFYVIGDYLLFGMNQDEKMLKELVNTKAGGLELLNARAVKDISVPLVGAIRTSSGYDLYASIKNPNENRSGRLSYCFKRGADILACGEDFILPGQKKYLLALKIADIQNSSGLELAINDISWKKINSREIPNWIEYERERSGLKIKNILLAGREEGAGGISFSIENNTPYGFWEVPLNIIVAHGGKIANVNRYILKELASFESRQIKISWPGEAEIYGEVSVYPDINILDANAYMPPAE